MTITGTINVRINKYIDGQEITYGVPVRVRPIVERSDKSGRVVQQTATDRPILHLLAPVGEHSNGRMFEVASGEYEVEAVLPSGETLSAPVLIAANQLTDVVLEGDPSPDEWRSWAHFAGSRRPSASRLALESAGSTASPYPATNFAISVGALARGQTQDEPFDPSSWEHWLNYLRLRHEHGSEIGEAPELRVEADTAKIDIFKEGGYGNLPLRIRLRQSGTRVPTTDIGRERMFVTVGSAAGTRVLSLPWPWPSAADGYEFFFDIMAVEEHSELVCDPVLLDRTLGGLIAYLNAGQVQLAVEFLKQAEQALFEKNENPLGAAAGGYVLMSALDQDIRRDLPEWLNSLALRFPNMPDGAILRARWLMQHDENRFDEAHSLLCQAVDRGIPFFTTGVVWLIEGLRRASIQCRSCEELLAMVRGVARSMDLSQAFTSFNLVRPASDLGALTEPMLEVPHGVKVNQPELDSLSYDKKTEIEKSVSLPVLIPIYTC